MGIFLRKYKMSNLAQEEIENLNRSKLGNKVLTLLKKEPYAKIVYR